MPRSDWNLIHRRYVAMCGICGERFESATPGPEDQDCLRHIREEHR